MRRLGKVALHHDLLFWFFFLFFFNDTATTEIYTLSLHDALPILSTAHCMDSSDFANWAIRDVEGGIQSDRIKITPDGFTYDTDSKSGIHVLPINPNMNWSVNEKRSEEHTSELQSLVNLVCRLLLEKKK